MKDLDDKQWQALNFEELRGELLRKHEATVKPIYDQLIAARMQFDKEWNDLDVVQALLNNNASKGTPTVIHRTFADEFEKKYTKPPRKKRASVVPPRIPYRNMHAEEAIIDILTLQPGLDIHEVTAAMLEGGYIFTSEHPERSIWTMLRMMVKAKKIDVVYGDKAEQTLNRYYIPKTGLQHKKTAYPQTAAQLQPIRRKIKLPKLILPVIQENPGITRLGVTEILLLNKVQFNKKSHHAPRDHVLWAMRSLVKKGLVRQEMTTNEHEDDIFTAIESKEGTANTEE